MKTINNQNKVAKQVNDLKLVGVSAVGDDGSVCIQVVGDKDYTVKVANIISDKVGDVSTGDGVQDGGMFVNNYDLNIHDDLSTVANM